jgi:membrane-bound lytic murein transglycosylase A
MRLYQAANGVKSHLARVGLFATVFAFFLIAPISVVRGEPPAALPILADDLDPDSLGVAIQRSISYLEKLPPDRIIGEQPRRFTAKELLEALRAFQPLLNRWDCQSCWITEFTERFELIPSSSDPEQDSVLFTGYYQPVVEASLVATPEYRYPIYGKPADLITAEEVTLATAATREKVVGRAQGESWTPYYSRREIDEEGSLRNRGYEIAWVKDPIELFFLHIQGSGLLQLQDGRRLPVGYAAANGRPYRSIGRLLIDQGKIPQEEMSMQRLRIYLTDHPEERNEIFAYNERYVFFRFLSDGPLGNLEVPLTPERSIATDARLFPKGALAFIVTQRPILDFTGRLIAWRPFSRFVLNQDTGGAIRGLQRVDVYFGGGDEAAGAAGFMNRRGKLYFLSVKSPSGSARSVR